MALSQIVRAASSRLISWPHAAAYQAFNGKYFDEGIRSLLLSHRASHTIAERNWNQEKELGRHEVRPRAAANGLPPVLLRMTWVATFELGALEGNHTLFD